MPRLLGYRERLNSNLWDCFNPAQLDNASVRLFGNTNIGVLSKTNMVQGRCVAGDLTLVITRWYARHNFAARLTGAAAAAWEAFAHSTTVTMVVGTRPVFQAPLVELMQPSPWGSLSGFQRYDDDALAEEIYTRVKEQEIVELQRVAKRSGIADDMVQPMEPAPWSDLTVAQKECWRHAAETVPMARATIVPVRQNFGVHIDGDLKAVDELKRVLPENVPPSPLVWVHLLGLQTRDVA